ncbi:MAG: TolC family protein [Bacteroidales bacterium]|nr:TolC family protein [Bacteroidales bacterium]
MISKRTIIIIILILLFQNDVCAQLQNSVKRQTEKIKEDQFPHLELLISAALKKSPLLKKQNSEILKDSYQVKRIKKYWMDVFSLGVTYQFSTAGQVIMDQLNQGYAVSAMDQENRGYLLTLSLRFTPYDILSRNNQVKIAYHELQGSVHQKNIYEQQVREHVIYLYNRLKKALKLIPIRSEARQSAEVHRQMAEKEFVEGEIPVSELARVTEIESKAIEAFETVQIEYIEAFQQLENFVGIQLSKLR